MKKKVYLTLQNGNVFTGYRFGAQGDVSGELVFSTSVVGYMETLTDPANYGQMVVQTFPLMGNYGAIRKDVESEKAWARAFIVREICETPSNFRSEGLLEDYLKEQGVVGVYGVDTRQLTKILREEGAMNACISSKPLTEEQLKSLAKVKKEKALSAVANGEKKVYEQAQAVRSVVVWDLGAKKNTIARFIDYGCNVTVMPTYSTADEILKVGAQGVVIAGVVGDAEENAPVIEEIKKLLGKTPIFGVDGGHLLVALATGAKIKKQKHGHRGSNQPVKSLEDGRVYVSSQNHGYEVVASSLTCGRVNFVNVNDGSCEGVEYPELSAFTVQFAPSACDLGNVENPLYEKFFALMRKEK